MENQKKHIAFHIDIDKEADRMNVQVDAEKPLVGELFACFLGVCGNIAATIAANTKESESKVLRNIAAMVSAMADEAQDKEEN